MLTTVTQPVQELAERSIRLLTENIDSCRIPRHETVTVALETRESAKEI